MLADTAKLAVKLDLTGNFTSNLKASQAALGKFDKQMSGVGSRAHKAGQQVGTGIRNGAIIAAGGLTFLASQVTLGLKSLATLEKAQAQTNAVLKSTGSVAGQNAESIRALSEEYEGLNATIDDKVIQSGQNLLLTFTNIRKEAFEPALEAALNLNTRLGGGEGGLQNTVKLLGKALNDPIKGLGALSKAGITFSKQQTDQIKKLVASNNLLGAQELILKELGKRYGGAFAAEGKTAEGTLAGIGDAAEDLQKTLATGLFPVISKLLPKIRAALADPRVVAAVSKLGDSIAGLFSDANLAEGGKLLGSLFDTAKAAAPVLKDAAVATLGAVRAAVSLFTSLPKEVQQLAVGAFAINKITGGLVTNLAGGLISSVLKQLVAGVVNVRGATVVVSGAGGIAGAAGAAGKGAGIASAIGKVFLVGAAVGVFSELKGILDDQSAANKQQAAGLTEQTAVYVKSSTLQDMKNALAGIDRDVANGIRNDALYAAAYNSNFDGVRDAINSTRSTLAAAIAKEEARLVGASTRLKDDLTAAAQRQIAATARTYERIEASRLAQMAGATKITSAVLAAKERIAAAARASGQQAAAAIRDKDLSVRVNTQVNTSVSLRTFVNGARVYSSYGSTAVAKSGGFMVPS